MKVLILILAFTSQFALADESWTCTSEPVGANNYSYRLEMEDGATLTIYQQSRNARYAPIKFNIEPVDVSLVGLEAQRFVCSKTRSTEDGYSVTLRVTDNYLFVEQSSFSARYELLAYKLLK